MKKLYSKLVQIVPSIVMMMIFTISCDNPQENGNKALINEKNIPERIYYTIIEVGDEDSVAQVGLIEDKDSVIVRGKVKGMNYPVSLYIEVKEADSLLATITTPGTKENLRFNQIVMPDGKADGPFGQSMKIKTGKSGSYHLIIGENLMQGVEYRGPFSITLKSF